MLQPHLQKAGAILISAGWDRIKPAIVVDGNQQRLYLLEAGQLSDWPVSTGLAGFGNTQDSGKTPTGLHRIAACIGANAPCGMVFKGRVATGEVIEDGCQPEVDYITTRILWLAGLEKGMNQGPGVDSQARYIYIHGTPSAHLLGKPVSAGCIRMDNQHIIQLFKRMQEGNLVLITPSA